MHPMASSELEEAPMKDDDSDPSKLVPVLMERLAAFRTELGIQTAMMRDIDVRLRHVEQSRSQVTDELRQQLLEVQQWRRDMETAKAAEAKATEPWRAVWKRAVEVVVVLSVGGAAAAAWRVLRGP